MRAEARRRAQVVAQLAQGRRGPQGDERLAGDLGQPDARTVAVSWTAIRVDQPASTRGAASGWPAGSARRSGSFPMRCVCTARSPGRVASAPVLKRRVPISRSAAPPSSGSPCSSSRAFVSRNPTPGCAARKLPSRSGTSQEPRDCGNATATDAGLRRHELRHGVKPAAQLVEQPVHVRLEHLPRAGQPQRPAGSLKQRRPDLRLKAGEGPRHAGLGDHLNLADLGHRHALGDQLEPAEHVSVHNP